MNWQDFIDQNWVRYLLLPGLLAAVLALSAGWADRRRMNRSDPDAVGVMPWRDLAFWSAFAAVLLLGLAAKAWMAP